MRILHIQKVSGIGGSERHLLSLLPALAARDHDVTMLVLAAPGAERFILPLRAAGVSVLDVPAGAAADPRMTARIMIAIRRMRPDIVHTHLVHADVHGLAVARVLRVPAVSTTHNADPLWRRAPVRRAARLAYGTAGAVIAISDFVRRYVESLGLVSAGRTRVIRYGIDAASWAPSPGEREAARAALDVPDDATTVGIAARCIAGKGHEVLFASMVRARERAPSLRLIVAGDGPLLPDLRRLAGDLPVSFLGHVEDIRGVLQACDVLAFPTLPWLGEGFGLAALEAMAVGVPVVASDSGALPEVVEDGRTGLVVSAGSVPALAEALVALAGDPSRREAMGEAARARAADVFSLRRMVEATERIYEGVA